MQNGQRFVVMYLLYRGTNVLAPIETVAGGDRAAVQEQGDRPDPGEGPADVAAAGEAATPRRGWKRKVNIPETDEDNTQSEVWAGTSAGVSARDISEHSERDSSVGWRTG